MGTNPATLVFTRTGWKSRDPWRKSSRPWGCSVGGNQVDLGGNQVDLGSSRLEAKPWVKVRFVFRFPGVTGAFSGRLGIWKLLGHFPGEMWVACWKGERVRRETSAPRPEFRSRIPVKIVTFSGRVKSRSSQVTLGYEPSDLDFYQDGLEIKGPLEEIKSTLGLLSWRKSSRPWRKSS